MNSRLLEDVVRARVNYERARAFGRPVLHSLDPQAVLVGYSVHSIDDEPVMIESNQLYNDGASELDAGHAFSLRSWSRWTDRAVEARLHAIDDLMMRDEGADTDRSRRAHARLDAHKPSHGVLAIDGEHHDAELLRVGERSYVSLALPDQTLVTMALPSTLLGAGFSSTVPTE